MTAPTPVRLKIFKRVGHERPTALTTNDENDRSVRTLFSSEKKRVSDTRELIYGASQCKLKEAAPIIHDLSFGNKGKFLNEWLYYFTEMMDESAVDDIGKAMMEKNQYYRSHCIHALEVIGSPRAVPCLLEMFQRELTSKNDLHWKIDAIATLEKIQSVESVEPLTNLLSSQDYKDGRFHIALCLCSIGDTRAFDSVVREFNRDLDNRIFTGFGGVEYDCYRSAFTYFKKIGN